MIETQSFMATTIITSSWLPNNVVNFRFWHEAASRKSSAAMSEEQTLPGWGQSNLLKTEYGSQFKSWMRNRRIGSIPVLRKMPFKG